MPHVVLRSWASVLGLDQQRFDWFPITTSMQTPDPDSGKHAVCGNGRGPVTASEHVNAPRS